MGSTTGYRVPPNLEWALWLDGHLGPITKDERSAHEGFAAQLGMTLEKLWSTPGVVSVNINTPGGNHPVECGLFAGPDGIPSEIEPRVRETLRKHFAPKEVVFVDAGRIFFRDAFLQHGSERD
jgi:hypothetical protein